MDYINQNFLFILYLYTLRTTTVPLVSQFFFQGEKHKVETKTIAFDFGARAGYEKIENELSSLDIGVLGMFIIVL